MFFVFLVVIEWPLAIEYSFVMAQPEENGENKSHNKCNIYFLWEIKLYKSYSLKLLDYLLVIFFLYNYIDQSIILLIVWGKFYTNKSKNINTMCASKRVRISWLWHYIQCILYTIYLFLFAQSADPNPFRGTHNLSLLHILLRWGWWCRWGGWGGGGCAAHDIPFQLLIQIGLIIRPPKSILRIFE